MFKVQENEDGSTIVFCKATGRQIFTVPPKPQWRIPPTTNVRRPINVVGPTCHVPSLNKEIAQGYSSDQDKDSNDSYSNSKDFATSFDDESEDFHNDSVTGVDFMRCLNLVPKQTLKNETLTEVLKEFPLRLQARNRDYRSKDDSFEEQKYQKLPDDLPITSKLGIRFLELNRSRNFLSNQKLLIALKKCDTFCRYPFNSPNPVECNFPKLRCREKKSYPTLPTKAIKQEATHVYSYGRRQRLDRMKTLKTGLNRESRRLRRICNAKKFSVVLNRLTEAEIQYWLSKKSEPIIITIEDSDDELVLSLPKQNLNIQLSVPSVAGDVSVLQNDITKSTNTLKIVSAHDLNERNIKSKHIIPNKNLAESILHSILTTSSSSGLVRLPKNPMKHFNVNSSLKINYKSPKYKQLAQANGCQDCYVKLKDVTKFLSKLRNEYYVKCTKIRVPFYADYLASVSLVKRLQVCAKQEKPIHLGNGLVISTVIRPNADKKVTSVLFPQKEIVPKIEDLTEESENRALQAEPRSETSKNLKIIPYIDLTLDSSPEKNSPVPTKLFVSQFLFRCHGCGFKKGWSSSSSSKANSTVKSFIHEHMQNFHSVKQPEGYLSSYHDTLRNCSIIEAFPGYKDK